MNPAQSYGLFDVYLKHYNVLFHNMFFRILQPNFKRRNSRFKKLYEINLCQSNGFQQTLCTVIIFKICFEVNKKILTCNCWYNIVNISFEICSSISSFLLYAFDFINFFVMFTRRNKTHIILIKNLYYLQKITLCKIAAQ